MKYLILLALVLSGCGGTPTEAIVTEAPTQVIEMSVLHTVVVQDTGTGITIVK